MAVYGSASNARLNLKKTVAFPLGQGMDAELLSLLKEDNVQTHSTSSEAAIVYLGFPIALNASQRDNFYDGLLAKVKHLSGIHTTRGLSIKGRGIVATSILLSKLWHVLSVDTPTKAWTNKIQGVIRKFVCPNFPAPSFDFLCQAKTKGGIGLINVGKQALAMQLKAIQRLVSTKVKSFAQPILKALLQTYSKSDYPFAALANPKFHLDKFNLFQGATTIRKWLRTLSLVPTPPPISTDCEDAPIDSVLGLLTTDWIEPAERPPQLPIWRMDQAFRLVMNDSDELRGHLEFIPSGERPPGARTYPGFERNVRQGFFAASNTLKKLLDQDTWIDTTESLSQRIKSYGSQPGSDANLGNMSTGALGRLLTKNNEVEEEAAAPLDNTPGQNLTTQFWDFFWKADIPHITRTVWWRLLIRILPSRKRLHSIMEETFEESCVICGAAQETDRHMMFTCPQKLQVWRSSLANHVGDMDFSWEFIELLLYGEHEQILPTSNISAIALLTTVLHQIWIFHFLHILEDKPFDATQVTTSIDLAVDKIVHQNEYRRRVQEERNRESATDPNSGPTTPHT